MTKINFGTKELIRCLTKLGFTHASISGSSHQKMNIPNNWNVPKGTRPFIIVILGKKIYDPHTRSSYINQIRKLGFDNKTIYQAFS